MLLVLFFISNQSFSQKIDLNKSISISVKNKKLSEVLSEIEKKTNVNFAFNNTQIDVSQRITIIARNKSLSHILTQIFSKLNITFSLVEKQIILKKEIQEIEIKKDEIKKTDNKFTISGYIRDSKTGEVLIGASVYLKNQAIGTVSNSYGFYSLTLPKHKYNVTISYLSYIDQTIFVNLQKNISYNVNLQEDNEKIEIVLITNENKTDFERHNPLKITSVYSNSLDENINIAGENDFIKTLSSINGINPRSDGSVMFSVRGGNYDQNIIFIDEAPVYNPSHLFGFFSAISPEAINKISIYKNNFPEKLGGRLSSIIDIKTKDGSKYKTGFSGKISPVTGSWTIDGPIVKNKVSYFISLRNSHINWLLEKIPVSIKFYDFHIKLNAKINRENSIFLSIFHGYDYITLGKTNSNSAISWNNSTFSLRWNHLYSDKLFSNTTFYMGKYDYFMYFSIKDNGAWNSLIGEIAVKNDFAYYINPLNTVRFGIAIKGNVYNPGNLNTNLLGRVTDAGNASEINLYLGNTVKLSDIFSLSYKLRMINRNNTGPATVYIFNETHAVTDTVNYESGTYNSFYNTEPRFSFTCNIDSSFTTNISYSRNIQYEQMLSNSSSPFTSLDVWLPAGINIPPQKAHQISFGIFKKFTEVNISFETYYKKLINITDFSGHPNLLLNPLIEGELRTGKGKAYGFEFSVEKQKGNFNFGTSYTYSRAINNISGVNFNKPYSASFDQPHNIKIYLSYNTGKRWLLSTNWQYSSGKRFSSPTGFFYYDGYSLPIYEQKNNSKLPDYHRLDISAKLNLNKKPNAKFKHNITFSIFNFYNRKNYIGVNFNKIELENNTFYVPANYITEREIIPTSTSLLGVFPAISYQFEFR